ncbi:MAG: hypothetical protein US49_C0007G0014 [candidate division TM6 bacterium GW2011_GWF2_37_49]|nr:MAG: hypothetical protein US49_C0007G0014 [candidate division TM6 bacterium GW2011_GWF2_37_49]
MKLFIKNIMLSILLSASARSFASSEFIIMPNKKVSVAGSKNTLKEKLGQSAKQAINFTTELGKLMGRAKVGFADKAEKMCKIGQISQMQKNDGNIQINLSSIQGSFADLVELLIDNKGFFKRASRGDLSALVVQMNDICKLLQCQVSKFEQLNISAEMTDQSKEPTAQVIAQFDASAKDMMCIQEKVKGLKCLKKS